VEVFLPASTRGHMSYNLETDLIFEADQKLGTGCDSCCIVGYIVKRSPQRYLVTEVLNMWEVSMEGSHRCMLNLGHSTSSKIKAMLYLT
jgi:hypothetical protein